MKRWMTMLLWAMAAAVSAHEGHLHEGDATISASTATAPRLALSQAPLELVAVREREELVIWIDDHDSNAPLTALRVQLRAGERLLQAQLADDGSYRLPAGLLDASQASAVEFIVQGHGDEQRLAGLLPAAAPEAAAGGEGPGPWIAAVAALLLGAALARRLRRRTAA